jgi:hypothetical protein
MRNLHQNNKKKTKKEENNDAEMSKGKKQEPEKGGKKDGNRRFKGTRKKRGRIGKRRPRGGRYAGKDGKDKKVVKEKKKIT